MISSQYKADSERAIEEVTLYLSSCCSLGGDGKDAWIFDVDDTNFYHSLFQEAWFWEIRDKGVKIVLVSSRRETLGSTVDNLIKVGYHGWTSFILRGLDDEYMHVQQYKSQVRKRLVDQGYRIWAIVGDQRSSLKGLSDAKRTFKLPNSIYYLS
ncbi:hypothetical protein CRYUN_Cryun20dG0089000 [Craigia yunnanensis]